MPDRFFVSSQFSDSIYHHIIGNLVLRDTESPLMLGVFGPAGEGKTFQTELVCRSLGIRLLPVSPGELESPNAGHPGEMLRALYLQASDLISRGDPAVIIINDMDTVLGNWGELVQYTVNRQVVYGQLMAFCDYPYTVSDVATARVPIIVTGNDPSRLYEPMLRPGRMRVMAWVPQLADRQRVVERLFPTLRAEDLLSIMERYPDRPVSFWADVRASVWERALAKWCRAQERGTVLRLMKERRLVKMDELDLSRELVSETARDLVDADVRNMNYLKVSGEAS